MVQNCRCFYEHRIKSRAGGRALDAFRGKLNGGLSGAGVPRDQSRVLRLGHPRRCLGNSERNSCSLPAKHEQINRKNRRVYGGMGSPVLAFSGKTNFYRSVYFRSIDRARGTHLRNAGIPFSRFLAAIAGSLNGILGCWFFGQWIGAKITKPPARVMMAREFVPAAW